MGRCQRSSFRRVNVSSCERAFGLHLCQFVKYFKAQSIVTLQLHILVLVLTLNLNTYNLNKILTFKYYYILVDAMQL